ncbi:hypothetical protein COV13_01015 [Candidatus Woesearchaeota archaeon CG10_big_fil_rev_8_21_14_0_10_32_9]|nr:MAG: hypothetical protein COV13_01015 [Candidatus Woesearchaeota archaeon CG10_big_fil_rev_8_21_14_0_10_32_9]
MPVIMPFGKYGSAIKGDAALSVEQLALKDYTYFKYIIAKVKYGELKERFDFVNFVANNFVSEEDCNQCEAPAKYISIWNSNMGTNPYNNRPITSRTSSKNFIYCSINHFKSDSNVGEKAELRELQFDSTLSETKQNTNNLVKIVAECLGIIPKQRYTKEALERIFNEAKTYRSFI